MSAFDIKPMSEQDLFKLEKAAAQQESSANANPPDASSYAPPAHDPDHSPVSEAVEQVMAHWADLDETAVKHMARESGSERLQRVVGEAALKDTKPAQGMAGDFQADTAGPDQGIDVPPKLGGSQFGGGGGSGSGEGGSAADQAFPGLLGDEGGMADPGDAPETQMDLGGFAPEAAPHYGGDGDGDEDDEDKPPKPPEDPKKPKKP